MAGARSGVALSLFAAAAALLAAPAVRAELDELSLTTLELAADVASRRDLALGRRVTTEAAPRARLKQQVAASLDPLDPRPALAEDANLYRRLGLLAWQEAPAADWPMLPAAYLAGEDRIVVARETRGRARDAAHRIVVHLALLDHGHGLAALVAGTSRDQQLAREAFVLGDAVVSSLHRRPSPREDSREGRRIRAISEARALLRSHGNEPLPFGERLSRARLEAGIEAVVALRESSPWAAIDELLRRQAPLSTAQLLDPSRLLGPGRPLEVEVAALPVLAGRGASRTGVLGALRTRLWLESRLDPSVAARAAAGWAGDHYALYPATSDEQPWTSTLVLLTVFEVAADGSHEEAADHAAALAEHARARGARAGSELDGATTFLDEWELSLLIERRDDAVLYVEGCPPEALPALREAVWQGSTVPRPASDLVDPSAPPPQIAPLPPPVPWYRRAPGLVALGLWLLVALPLLGLAGRRLAGFGPLAIYSYGLVATAALIVLGWLLGL